MKGIQNQDRQKDAGSGGRGAGQQVGPAEDKSQAGDRHNDQRHLIVLSRQGVLDSLKAVSSEFDQQGEEQQAKDGQVASYGQDFQADR